jgi:hypothetical protein
MNKSLSSLHIKVPIYFLLFAVGIAPIGLVLQNASMPTSADSLGLFSWIYLAGFGLTHILTSVGIFYTETSSQSILFQWTKWIPLVVVLAIFFLNDLIFESVFVLLISWHVTGQAVGVLRLWGSQLPHPTLFKALSLMPILCSFIFIFSSHFKKNFIVELIWFFQITGVLFTTYFIWCLIQFKEKKTLEFLLFTLTGLYIIAISWMGYVQNFFLWVLIFMFGHDFIATSLYSNYFKNRFSPDWKTVFFIILFFVSLSIGLLVASNHFNWLRTIMFFQIVHYAIETFMWKRSSHFRNFISLGKE